MPQFRDKDDMLDKLYDHVFGDGDPSPEDEEFFDHLSKFFDDEGNSGGDNGNTHRRRQRQQQGSGSGSGSGSGNGRRSAPPPRRRQTSTSSGYGSSTWFGSN